MIHFKGKEYPNGKIIIYADYRIASRCGAEPGFQVIDIWIEDGFGSESILEASRIDQGKFFYSGKSLIEEIGLDPDEIDFTITSD